MLFGGDPPLEEGERRVTTVRSHGWVPVRAALPLPLLVLSPALYAGLDLAVPDLRLAAAFPIFLWLAGAVFVAYLVKWLCLDLLPWTQRVYVLTNRRVIAQWGVLAVHRRECSLLKIEESDYDSRGPMARLLDIGDVEVETSGRLGAIVLRSIPQPRRLQGLISIHARALRDEETRRRLAETPHEIMRQLVAATGAPATPHEETTEEVRPVTPRRVRAQKRLNVLPDEAVVEVMHQHPVVLVVGLLAPLLATLFIAAVTAVVGFALLPFAVALVVLVLAPWAVWRVLGYLAHEYVLTTERLMELRSSPFLYETRDIVQLAAVQDVSLEIPTLFGRLADIGDVIVEVAGPSERVVLKTVAAPADLQKRIFETIDARQRRQREREDERLVSTLSRWFQEYHRLQDSSQ